MTMAETAPKPTLGEHVEWFVETWGRMVLSVVAILAQLVAFVVFAVGLVRYTGLAVVVATALGVVALVWLVNRRMPTSFKLAWAIPVLVIPVVGPLFFMVFGTELLTPRQRKALTASSEAGRLAVAQEHPLSLTDLPPSVRRQATYLTNVGRQPPTTAETAYFPTGEGGFEEMLKGIATAERYVFCQFFMVAAGVMFERLFEALAEKAKAGLDVRLLYDDFGSSLRRPHRLAQRCDEVGIKVHPVNPLGIGLTLRHNNRDHRKLCIVDGTLAFTGGINIGDEYINEVSPYGYWKDNVVRAAGTAAWPCTVAFLSQWRMTTDESVDLTDFKPPASELEPAEHVVIPFDETPFDRIHIALAAYRAAISNAARQVDITTPYLVVDDTLTEVLTTAARSGVRVRVVCPGTNDGWAVGHVTRACQRELILGGVEVYEYQPGFIHSKVLLADDDVAIVGTVNLDYRSLYLHHENGLWMHEAACLAQVRTDIEGIIAASRQITKEDLAARPWHTRILRAVLRVFAPLM
jgi:cardiolipin synthase